MLLNQNLKLKKAAKFGINQFGLELLPHSLSGVNLCVASSKSCRATCLVNSGHSGMKNSIAKKKYRTDLFLNDKVNFISLLVGEITYLETVYKNIQIRLNVFSDIEWENIKYDNKNIFEHFPKIKFFDYTKISYRLKLDIKNYHVVFSGQENNRHVWSKFLNRNNQVALVFTKVPETYHGYPVVSGDESDNLWQWKDRGVILGLKYKNVIIKDIKNKDLIKDNKLVIQNNV